MLLTEDNNNSPKNKKSFPQLLDLFFENLIKLLIIGGGFYLLITELINKWQTPYRFLLLAVTLFTIFFIIILINKINFFTKISIIVTSYIFLVTFSIFKYGGTDFKLFYLSPQYLLNIIILLLILIWIIFIFTRSFLPKVIKLFFSLILLYIAIFPTYYLIFKRELEINFFERIPFYLSYEFLIYLVFSPLFFLIFFFISLFKKNLNYLSLSIFIIPLFLISSQKIPYFFSQDKEFGLLGRYYKGDTFSNFVFSRIDPKIDFDWKEEGPSKEVGSYNFWVEWIGKIYIPISGEYIFALDSDDGSLLYINGIKFLDNWKGEKGWKSEKINLKKGFNKIRVHFYQTKGGAHIRLGWKTPYDTEIKVISNRYLRGKIFQRTPFESAQLGLEWLQSESYKWEKKYSCYGCHTQSYGIMGISIGKEKGYIIDDNILDELTKRMEFYQNSDGSFGISGQNNISGTFYAGVSFAYYSRYVSNRYDNLLQSSGEFLEKYLSKNKIKYDWIEPPIMYGEILLITSGIITLNRVYELTRDNSYINLIEKLKNDLINSSPVTTQDKAFKLIGLSIFQQEEYKEKVKEIKELIYSSQNKDGGWSEREGLKSNAYATGEVLYSLKEVGEKIGNSYFRSGVKYLMDTQHMEGYWSYIPNQNTDSHRPSNYAPTMWGVIGLASAFAPLNIDIIEPENESIVKKETTIKVSIENYTDSPISYVEYFVEGEFLAKVETFPYDFKWEIDKTPYRYLGGAYQITAKAVTTSYEYGEDSIIVKIKPELKIKILSPISEEYVNGKVNIKAKVTSSFSSIKEVFFQIDENNIASFKENYETYETVWDFSKETTGKHTIKAWVISESEKDYDEVVVKVARGKISVISSSYEKLFPSFMELILDSSGSMWGKIKDSDGKNRTKIEVAKKVLSDLIEKIPEGKSVGLRIYGHRFHRRFQNCTDSELVVPLLPIDKPKLLKEISQIYPQGMTPIAYSLEEASKDLEGKQGTIVLVTDGKESCNRNPCEVVKKLIQEKKITLKIHTIGFDVSEDLSVQEQLSCIANATQGEYFLANDAKELNKALEKSTKINFDLFTSDNLTTPFISGRVNGDSVVVPKGSYKLVVYSEPIYEEIIEVKEDEEKVVTIY